MSPNKQGTWGLWGMSWDHFDVYIVSLLLSMLLPHTESDIRCSLRVDGCPHWALMSSPSAGALDWPEVLGSAWFHGSTGFGC